MIIYLITNKITGQMYVGAISSMLLQTRWRMHCNNKSSCTEISKAIKQYGKESFYIDQIDNAKTKRELIEKEIYWIKILNTIHPFGYNLQSGGRGGLASEQTKKRIKEAYNNRSDETKEKLQRMITEKRTGKRYKKRSRVGVPIYKGVSYRPDDKNHKRQSRFQVSIQVYGKQKHLGWFKCAMEAAKAYDKAVLQYYGNDYKKYLCKPYFNFPELIDFSLLEKEPAYEELGKNKVKQLLLF